jgi:tetratricopeptide (TPR) repeat protein
MNYQETCFVIMPFRVKTVDGVDIDFDAIYDRVFEPAIKQVPLPEGQGKKLIPKRTDKDFSSGVIDHEMFQYLEYSRMAMADLTSLNPNVLYELGVRHRARESGTALFRQAGVQIPFDIAHIKTFDYRYATDEEVKASQELIIKVLTESLKANRIDNGVNLSLIKQQEAPQPVDDLLKQAENALLNQDPQAAIAAYREAVGRQPENALLHQRIGLLLKGPGTWDEALRHFERAAALDDDYADAWRERGIVENRLRGKEDPTAGEASLRHALELNPQDYDAHASLGGVLRRQGRLEEAAQQYTRAAELSNNHPYPLLNALKLRAIASGAWVMDARTRFQLGRAETVRAPQVAQTPPYDKPWCIFDLAEIRLYQERLDEFDQLVATGANHANKAEMETFRNSLGLLADKGLKVPGLDRALATLDEFISFL